MKKKRFSKIEAEKDNFIPAVEKWFDEIEKRVADDETCRQASAAELCWVEELDSYKQGGRPQGKGKEGSP